MSRVHKIVLDALLAAILIVSKEALAAIPNVELVTFLLIMYALHFELKDVMLIAITFCFAQSFLYGFGTWTITYFIVWPLLGIATNLLKGVLTNETSCAILSALFGFSFGSFFAIPSFLLSVNAGFAYILAGLPFDLIHGIANFIVMMLLYDPIKRVLQSIRIQS